MVRAIRFFVFVTALSFAAPAFAQRFSSPETPVKVTPAAPDAPPVNPAAVPVPAQDDPANHRVGGGGGFELPLTLYDEKADAARDISRARERAKKDNRRVLVMWGENRCEFCAYLNQLLQTDPRLKQLVESEYVWVKVDIGKFDKNIELANRYDTPIDKQGFGAPALTAIEPSGDQAIGAAGGNEMVNKPMMPPNRVFDPDFVFNFLDKNKPQPKVANSLALDSQMRAKRDGKRVLLYFNVYGSDACKAFDKAVMEPELETILAKAFVVRKIDVERNVNGYTLLRNLKENPLASPPWMTVVDGEGKPVMEAGKGVEFDPAGAAEAAKWIVAASAGKLDSTDEAAITEALKPQKKETSGEAGVEASR